MKLYTDMPPGITMVPGDTSVSSDTEITAQDTEPQIAPNGYSIGV